jgi:hypothetical protein
MTFTTLLNIELIGFMISLVVNYYLGRKCVEFGIDSEEEINSEVGLVVVISLFWWLFWPYCIYNIIKWTVQNKDV